MISFISVFNFFKVICILFFSFYFLASSIVVAKEVSASKSSTQARTQARIQERQALIFLAADRIDSALNDVAKSTQAIGDEYAFAFLNKLSISAQDKSYWIAKQQTLDKTTSYQSWPQSTASPNFQDQLPAFFHYGLTTLNDNDISQLNHFQQLVPTFRSAFKSFDYSWVYLTTVDNNMLLYPYLPLKQAVSNYLPTEQVFYTSANFKDKKVGWTLPYLDLVGAGMMITASYPIYSNGQLLGVSSRDVTINELSESVFNHLVKNDDISAFIVDRRGLVIDASDPKLTLEMKNVNTKKAAAALYYRSAKNLKSLVNKKAVNSQFSWLNEIMEIVFSKQGKNQSIIHFNYHGKQILVAEIKSTGWLLVMYISD